MSGSEQRGWQGLGWLLVQISHRASTAHPSPCCVLILQQPDVLDANLRARPHFRLGDLLSCSPASARTVPGHLRGVVSLSLGAEGCSDRSVPGAGQGGVLLPAPAGRWQWDRPCCLQTQPMGLSSTGASWVGQSSSLSPAVQSIPVAVVLQENPLPHCKDSEQGWAPL